MLKVFVPLDGSAAALDGVRHVMRLVHHGLRAEVVLGHVQPQPNLFEVVTARDPDLIEGAAERAADDAFRPAEQLLHAMKIPTQRAWALGDPARVLVELIERHPCDMVVMSASETSDVHSAVFGSISHAVLNHTTVPVTMVRPAAGKDLG